MLPYLAGSFPAAAPSIDPPSPSFSFHSWQIPPFLFLSFASLADTAVAAPSRSTPLRTGAGGGRRALGGWQLRRGRIVGELVGETRYPRALPCTPILSEGLLPFIMDGFTVLL